MEFDPRWYQVRSPGHVKGIISFFPKCMSYSVEGVDEGDWRQQSMFFFFLSKLPYLQMPALQSRSGCQPVIVQAGCNYSCKYPYNPIDLTRAPLGGGRNAPPLYVSKHSSKTESNRATKLLEPPSYINSAHVDQRKISHLW